MKKKKVHFHYARIPFEPQYIVNSKYKNVGEIKLIDTANSSELIKNNNIIFNSLNKNIESKYYYSVGIIINPNLIWKEINNYNELILKINIKANNDKTLGKKIKFYNGIEYIINDIELTDKFQIISFKCSFNPKNFINKNRIGLVNCTDLLSYKINNIEYIFNYNSEKPKNELIDLNGHYNHGGNFITNKFNSLFDLIINANSLDNELTDISKNIFFKD